MEKHEVLPRLPEAEERRPQKPHHRWIPWVLMAVFAVVAVLAWRAVTRSQQQEQAARAAQARAAALRPVPVMVATVARQDLPVYLTGLGTVTAYNTDTIQTRVDGEVMKVFFREGQHVNSGQLLVQIDPRPYQVQLDQAQGQLAKDQAQLHDALLDQARDKSLLADGVIPRQQYDTQNALVGQVQGAIVGDKAQIGNAQLNLAYCQITAPISGKVGLRLVDPGNIVHAASTTGLLVITQMEPIAVIFTLPEEQLTPILQGLRRDQNFRVLAYDRAGQHLIATGTLLATDNLIDQTTGTLRLKAVFPNKDEMLFPNEFVNVRIETEVLHNAVVIPAAALQSGSRGNYVFVVKADNTVALEPVQTSLTQGNSVVVSSGVQPGETVVTDGQDKLRNGSHVTTRTTRPAGARAA
ncbi:MAG TPA: MdtA/MuxA family multidrug efflux RND transporter periplasmic adaptor subunit [Terriglobia bacterium]|nr:MdtA/MuxA family multidrug efflux RND transporter periplasmic adaptor subunit [Terriglobia bacterium]